MQFRISRTYPQPDSPAPNIGPRERAMATFKYLLDMEPEIAVRDPRFAFMVHAFEQAARKPEDRQPSIVEMISTSPCTTSAKE